MAEGYTPMDTNKDENKTENKKIHSGRNTREDFFTSVPSSPPKQVSVDELMKMRTRVEKMILSHEIAMQDDFKLHKNQPPATSLEGKVREIMEKAFWDILDKELKEEPPNYNHALTLLVEIKQELLEMLTPAAQSMRAVIEEVLDLDLIRQKLEHDAFQLTTYSEFTIEIMSKMCAPLRDEHIERLKKMDNIVPLYQEIFKLLGLMKLDLANFTIQVAKPLLKQHSSEVERQKFLEILRIQQENGVDGLMLTKIWLANSFKYLLSAQLSPQSSAQPQEPLSPPTTSSSRFTQATICEAYLSLICLDVNMPETMLLDAGRIAELKDKLGTILFIAFTFAVSSATVARHLDEQFKEKLKSQLLILTQNNDSTKKHSENSLALCDQMVSELNGWLLERGDRVMQKDQETSFRSQITSCTDPSIPPCPVFKLLHKRLTTFLREVLTNTQKNFTIPQGYSSLSTELTSLVRSFLHVITHNQSVFGVIYSDIINDLIKKQNTASPSSTTTTSTPNNTATVPSTNNNTTTTSISPTNTTVLTSNNDAMDTSDTNGATNNTS